MESIERILLIIKEKGECSGSEICRVLGFSRQALNRQIKRLVAQGKVLAIGSTKGTRYRLADGDVVERTRTLKRRLALAGLQEDRVFATLSRAMNLPQMLAPNVNSIFAYAFTEMLNNAIDHSQSKDVEIRCMVGRDQASFSIRDRGIGVFANVARLMGSPDEWEAVSELTKGKVTTQPDRHTGEGIFFTSKLGDRFVIRSHRLQVLFDNERPDVFVGQQRFLQGTEIHFTIRRRSRRVMKSVFSEYAPERHDFRFSRTRAYVKLFQRDYVSRSEARRLLAGLDKFREVELDFRAVQGIGQGFADEVFRVFAKAHPETVVSHVNTNPAVRALISHVSSTETAP